MILAQNTMVAVANILDLILTVYFWLIIARALISWVEPNPYNSIVNFLYSVTEPVLEQVRRIVPMIGGFDLSPIAVLILIQVVKQVIVNTLYGLAHGL